MRSFKPGQIYLFFLISALAVSCGGKKEVDVSDIKLKVKIERFDQDLAAMTPATVSLKAPSLHAIYGAFYEDYMEKMLAAGPVSDTAYYSNLRTILNAPDYKALQTSVAQTFPQLDNAEAGLTAAFKHVKYYYPKTPVPRLIAFLSGFSAQTSIGSNVAGNGKPAGTPLYIGVGLDMFLGANSRFYPAIRASVPVYITRRFTPENIAPRVMEAFVREGMFPEPENNDALLAKMIYNGKIMYMLDAFMPKVPDSLKIGYTQKQQEWCTAFEAGIWAYFLEQNLLYETDYMKIQNYLTDAPFTPGIGEGNESAPKLGVWLGWQIIRHYMEANPGVTLQALVLDNDYQRILSKSKYKPK